MEKGRNCSLAYILNKNWTKDIVDAKSDVLYIVGGLYGNSFALNKINELAKSENAQIIFNGDMHWFDVKEEDFLSIEKNSEGNSIKLLGNVEYELISKDDLLGCGCNYPEDVDSGVVDRSNIIHKMMKENVKNIDILEDIKSRKKTLVVRYFDKNIAITHGDEKSMSGWECSHNNLQNKARQKDLDSWFEKNNIDIMATTHTCLPVVYNNGKNIVVNNGASGMANIINTTYGLVTRISKTPSPLAIISEKIENVYVELIKIEFDIDKFLEWFESIWNYDSPASISYKNRIINGTNLEIKSIKVKL